MQQTARAVFSRAARLSETASAMAEIPPPARRTSAFLSDTEIVTSAAAGVPEAAKAQRTPLLRSIETTRSRCSREALDTSDMLLTES